MTRYFADRFEANGLFYVFDRDDNGAECEGPFDTLYDAIVVAHGLNNDEQAGVSDPRPDPVTNPEYWTE